MQILEMEPKMQFLSRPNSRCELEDTDYEMRTHR